jgi:hypothetical protein
MFAGNEIPALKGWAIVKEYAATTGLEFDLGCGSRK